MQTKFNLDEKVILSKTKTWSPYWSGSFGIINGILIDKKGIHYSVTFEDEKFSMMMDEESLEAF
jgi:hypothetical protein